MLEKNYIGKSFVRAITIIVVAFIAVFAGVIVGAPEPAHADEPELTGTLTSTIYRSGYFHKHLYD